MLPAEKDECASKNRPILGPAETIGCKQQQTLLEENSGGACRMHDNNIVKRLIVTVTVPPIARLLVKAGYFYNSYSRSVHSEQSNCKRNIIEICNLVRHEHATPQYLDSSSEVGVGQAARWPGDGITMPMFLNNSCSTGGYTT
jgi:hypothetical protein